MTTRKAQPWQPPKPPRPKRPPCQLYRILTPPDICHYAYGRVEYSNIRGLRAVPIITFGGKAVALLDMRCIIETFRERRIVYLPWGEDVSWYRDHPADGYPPEGYPPDGFPAEGYSWPDGYPWAEGDVG